MKQLLLLFCFPAVILLGCSSSKNILAENTATYKTGDCEKAHQEMATLLERTSNEAYPLYQLTDASMLLTLGDNLGATNMLASATRNLEVDLGAGTIATDLMGSEENTHYRGYVHERVLAYYYLGISYLRRGYLDSARIAFQQGIERDINKEEGKENTFAILHFMLGETFLRLRQYENAVVAFRNATRLNPSATPAWYKLSVALRKQKKLDEAQKAYLAYKDSSYVGEALLPEDGSGSYIYMIADLGWGPSLSPDFLTGQFASYTESKYPDQLASISVDGKEFESHALENVYAQAKAEANLAGDVTKKLASAAVKKAMSYVPVLGLFAGSTAADVRKWLLLPGEIHVALIPTTEGTHTVTINFSSLEGLKSAEHCQTWYYVPAGKEGAAPIVYVRSIPRLQDQRRLTNQ